MASRGLFDVAQIRLAALVERSGDADQNGVHFLQTREIGGGVEALGLDVALNFFGGDVLDVGLAGVELFDFFVIEVEAGDALSDVRETQSERQADVTAADDADLDVSRREEFRSAFCRHLRPLVGIEDSGDRPQERPKDSFKTKNDYNKNPKLHKDERGGSRACFRVGR